MQALLATLVALLPLAAASPLGLRARDDNKGCQAASFGNFAWTIQDFDYHASYIFTTPAHQNSWGYVNFNLTNPALTYAVQCSGQSSQLSDFFYGSPSYPCTGPNGTKTDTTFDFNRATGELRIQQTWTCSDQDPKYPVRFTANGATNLTLDCTDETEENADWQMGEIYSNRQVKCKPVSQPLKPSQISAVA